MTPIKARNYGAPARFARHWAGVVPLQRRKARVNALASA